MTEEEIKKSPSFQLYAKDALDLKVTRMSDAAQGVYWRLLFNIWAHTKTQYSIENNDKELAKMLGKTIKKWKKIRKEIQREGDPILIEHGGMLVSKRLMQERERQLVRRKQTQAAANIRWEKQRMQTHMQTQCPSFTTSIATSTSDKQTDKYVYTCDRFKIAEDVHKKYQDAFPDVDLMNEYKKIAARLASYPKHEGGTIMVFVYKWLENVQGGRNAIRETADILKHGAAAKGLPPEAGGKKRIHYKRKEGAE